jgi:hypothetical protein
MANDITKEEYSIVKQAFTKSTFFSDGLLPHMTVLLLLWALTLITTARNMINICLIICLFV